MFENKLVKTIIGFYFTVLAFLMYYFFEEVAYFPIGVSYRHIVALVIIASTFVLFLIKPQMAEAFASVKTAVAFSMPMFVVLVASVLVWVMDLSEISVINRGLSTYFFLINWLSFALAATSLLYVFGEDGIWYNLLALVAANIVIIIGVMAQYGVGSYMQDFFNLIISFAENTGTTIQYAEAHELAFCNGAYLLYMICKPRKKAWFWALFVSAAFCFVSAFKRIAIIAIAVALAVRLLLFLLGKFSEKRVKIAISVIMLAFVVVAIAYVAVIRADVFTLMEKAGINTSGRDEIYEWANQFYEFSPFYMGRGIGFLTYTISIDETAAVDAVHNDYLQFFVDLGFWGCLFWLMSMTIYRTLYFGKHGDTDTAIITCVITIYLLICSSTDNTMNYPLLTLVMAIIIIGNSYSSRVDRQKEKFAKRLAGET